MDSKILAALVLTATIPISACAQTTPSPTADSAGSGRAPTESSSASSPSISPAVGTHTQPTPSAEVGGQVRGSVTNESQATSDRAVSRNWDGLGSTGGGTGTGESSGTIAEDLPPSAPRQ